MTSHVRCRWLVAIAFGISCALMLGCGERNEKIVGRPCTMLTLGGAVPKDVEIVRCVATPIDGYPFPTSHRAFLKINTHNRGRTILTRQFQIDESSLSFQWKPDNVEAGKRKFSELYGPLPPWFDFDGVPHFDGYGSRPDGAETDMIAVDNLVLLYVRKIDPQDTWDGPNPCAPFSALFD